ncbi:MAG: methyltransferase domain-containing protein [Candidatus Abyssobacteria bacterium SURF_5]|uniref:Methyltransferase domain-containing protein n=1 Tax=Abyssobacteria bacterium (strain SURF_5) TaxID=2093360 RepID=A0A3A4P6A7_ABYX5|nr:MAG: methyltransferase domain-containing protein [Candidatus Abyssubacteria bacterium SURF_5]
MADSKKKIGTERIQNIVYGFKHSAILWAGIELSLFTKVSEGACTIQDIASACGLSPLNAERMVVACTALGLLEKKQGKYVNAADVEEYLVEGKPRYFGAWSLMGRADFSDWLNLCERLTSPQPPSVLGIYEKMGPEQHEMLTRAMFNVGLGAGHKLAKQFDFSNHKLVLDLGGGSGAYCVALCRRFPQLRAIVFDFPDVCRVTDELIADSGLSDRIKTNPGDFTRDRFLEGVDAIMLNGNLTQYGPDEVRVIARRAYQALPPGGVMHIIAENLNDDKTGPLIAATWSIHEALLGSKGRAHSDAEVTGYLEEAGFRDVAATEFVQNILQRVTGWK